MININLEKVCCKQVDSLVIPFFEDQEISVPNQEVTIALTQAVKKGQFKAAFGELIKVTKTLATGELQDVLAVGLGKEADLTVDKVRKVMSKAVRELRKLNSENARISLADFQVMSISDFIKGIVEGVLLGDYKFDKFKSDRKDKKVMNIYFSDKRYTHGNLADAAEALEESKALVEGTILARDLVNEPANIMTPALLAQKAEEAGAKYGFEVAVKEKAEIEELGMEAFLSVAKGSAHEPKLIVMRYFGDEDNKDKIEGLVGKGLTFDTGGYSLKPTDSMLTMKSDMGGSAAVIGAMSIIAQRKLKKNVIAVVAACENAISGAAYKPGDIIGSMGKKFIEIVNTDAEGRLTLIDAVNYIIEKEKVSSVVDIATLTGAALIGLGTTTTAVLANNDEFYKSLEEASASTGEKVWRLPIFDEYKELNKSKVADLKNAGGRFAGTITAGLFIGEFVQDKPWMHLDIAGTAWTDSVMDYSEIGGTGEGARLLYELVKRR